MNEKYLAVKKRKNEIEIYQIPLEINQAETNLKEYGKLFCTINPSCSIKDFKLNPNYLNILVIVNYQKVLFFDINECSQKKGNANPKFVYDKNEVGFNSIVFNPFNSHIVACSCLNPMIQVWSVKRPSILKIPCYNIATELKWRKCGSLLGFIEKDSLLKIYDTIRKEFIFYLDYEDTINNYGFFGNDSILVDNSDNNKILKYKFIVEQKGDLKITKKNEYEDILENI